MPGTGHSARYKGSISNRSKVSPFEHLAKWNQQLLGADGMVPSITGGGGGLEFKKLNASDISGVMSNPATADLNMNNFKITDCNQINTKNISNIQQINAANTLGLNIQSGNGGGININTTDLAGIRIVSNTNSTQGIKIGYYGGNGTGNINIGWDSGSTGDNNLILGSGNTAIGTTKRVLIMNNTVSGGASHSLIMGNSSLTNASLSSLTTSINGTNTLKLSGGQITIGTNTSRLGFFGQPPQPRPTVAANALDIRNALIALGLFQ